MSNYKIDGAEIHRYILEPIKSNMYIIVKNGSALIIDPHVNPDADYLLRRRSINKIWIILTHEHFDHISGVNHFRENWDCTAICGHFAKEYLPNPKKNLSAYFKGMLIDKDEEITEAAQAVFDEEYSCFADIGFEGVYDFIWEGISLHLVETPGHSKGSICVLVNNQFVFTGDSLVEGNPIITRLPGGSKKDYLSVTKPFLEHLSKEIVVFPGHGTENNICRFEII